MKSFKHSGSLGDIIFRLPTIKALGGGKLYLFTGTPYKFSAGADHPNGDFLLLNGPAQRLKKLLLLQDYLQEVLIINYFEGLKKMLHKLIVIDYDLDDFRKLPIMFYRGSISRWYFYVFNVYPDLNMPWITIKKDIVKNNKILVNRTPRYRNDSISYKFLLKYDNVYFIGIERLYELFKKLLPSAKFLKRDFVQTAELMRACKFFIGNRSSMYSIALAMKIKRIMLICPQVPNNIPYGGECYDFYYQKRFELNVLKLATC